MKKFNVGDIVTLQQYVNNNFRQAYYNGEYYTESKIPHRLIIHGSLTFKDGKGEVVDYHEKYVIVKLTTDDGIVQLGFDEHDLIPVEPAEPQFKFIM